MNSRSAAASIRILALLEGESISGPAKNLLEYCRLSQNLAALPAIKIGVALFARTGKRASLSENQLLQAVTAAGLEVFPIFERFPFDPIVLGSLRRLMRSFAPDIVETHHVKSHFLVRLCRSRPACPWIAFHHGYTEEGARMALYNQLDRWSLRVPAKIVTVCEPFRQQLLARGAPPGRVIVLHNAIPLDWLNGFDAQPGAAAATRAREYVVLAAGRFSREKRFNDLVRAMAELRNLRPDLPLKLLLLGEGPERAAIEQTVRELGLQHVVQLPGHIRDVRSYYRRAHVLAISSASEGSPNVLLEAMAASVPVVATAVGGIPEIVSHGETAMLVKPRDPEGMAAALNLVLSDHDLAARLATNARQLIARCYSAQARAQTLMELYLQTCRGRS